MKFWTHYFYFISSIMLTSVALSACSSLLNPLLAAFIVALALYPLTYFFETRFKLPALISAFLCVSVFIAAILMLITFFTWQLSNLNFEITSVQSTYDGLLGRIQHWIGHVFAIELAEQTAFLKKMYTSILSNSMYFVNNTLSFTTHFLSSLILFAVSLLFILYYRRFFVSFLYQVVPDHHKLKLSNILKRMPLTVKQYVLGLSLIILIIAVLNALGLYCLGIDNALFFGSMAAFLTLIPYIGITIGAILPMLYAFFTKQSLWYPLGVVALFMFVQFLEGNFLTPKIVGQKVKINPFAAIWGLIISGTLLGLMGVLLAIPLLAIMKIICDEVPTLKPIGYLMGTKPST
ncbi:MAG: permease [Legionellaceae bacterium]|nr:permease [Legionellaceae bacterium]HAF88082.1 AI-2E family transporter [Legionellales bacterium]HCA89512.1 AI-2E family transporter [Legionellales bacterium]|tara:strand:+ start:55 stop:1098 length:1044 start_codon:yes stop_codon:yes gene_type:complete